MSQFGSLYVMTASLIHFSQGKANSIHLITASSCNYPVPPLMGQHGGSGLDSRLTNPTETYNIEQCSVPYHTVNKDESLQKKGITVLQHPLHIRAFFSDNLL